jgi:competence protein ComEA
MALAREARAQMPLEPGERIDIATAPEEELRRLTGVGPSLASAIIRERTARPFRSVRDLDRVPGVGPATFDRLKDAVEVGSSALVPPPIPASSERVCGGDRVELNAARAPDLETLPGVGPALAGRILDLRVNRGGFDSPEDLRQVTGIGDVTFARLAPLICVR